MSDSLKKQIDGTHYKDMSIQPWEIIEKNNLDYFEGAALKYLLRWKKKDGIIDLDKISHYIERIKELAESGNYGAMKTPSMIRVYVAGAYSDDNALGVLHNIRKGLRLSTEVMLRGFAPYCPWLDHQFIFALREDEKIFVPTFQEASLSWLECCDAMILVPGYENSKGTAREIEVAKTIGIPIFHDLGEMTNSLTNRNR